MSILLLISILLASVISMIITKKRVVIEALSLITSGITCIASFLTAFKVSSTGTLTFLTFFSVDALGAIVLMIIGSIGLATTLYSIAYLHEETKKQIIGFTRVKQYFVLLQIFLFAMYLAITAGSPIFAWIAIEATTLSTAFLISFYNKPSAIEGAWKYLIINSVGLLLGFFGTLLYFTAVTSIGEGGFVSWQTLRENAGNLSPLIAKIAFVFVLIGYGTKVGFAPMHTWLPDAHSKAPAPISSLLSGVLLTVAFSVILRFKVLTDMAISVSFSQHLLLGFGLFSIIIATLIILTQKNYKRLIAYSSIENMGVIALGFGFGGLGVFASFLHMIYNAFAKSALFLTAGTIFLKYSSTKIASVRGVLQALPFTGVLFFALFLAISGIPPFGIFLTKLFIFSAGIDDHPLVALTALLFITILFVGFLKHIAGMTFGEKPDEVERGEIHIWLILPPLFLFLVVFFLSFFLPPFLRLLLDSAVLHYSL